MRSTRVLLALLVIAVLPMLLACPGADSKDAAPAQKAEKPSDAEPAEAPLNCADQPYVQRAHAARDAYSQPTNFLRCNEGAYALCYYSGAAPLPCTLAEDGTAGCKCQIYQASKTSPMFVEIGGILNECVYNETVAQCGEDGSKCLNMCTGKGDHEACEGAPDAAEQAVACGYIARNAFNPDAEFISTFSFATVVVPETGEPFKLGSNARRGRYAGCMTAPCSGQTQGEDPTDVYTTCNCPLWPAEGEADYQFGRRCDESEKNPLSPRFCKLEPDTQVWSAAVHQKVNALAPTGDGAD